MLFRKGVFAYILVPHLSHQLCVYIIDSLLVLRYFLQFVLHLSLRFAYDFDLSFEDVVSMSDVFDFFVRLLEFLHKFIFIVLESCYPALERLSQGCHLIHLSTGDLLRRLDQYFYFLPQSQVVNFDLLLLNFWFVLLTLLQLRTS